MSFSFAHAADFHFGRTKHSKIDPSTGLQTSLVNDMEAFHEFIGISEAENVDVFVMAGDVFDKIHVSNAVRKEVARAFRRILEKRHLYVIVGTHDRSHDKYAAHTLSDWMNLAGGAGDDHMSRLHIFEEPSSVIHYSDDGKELGQIIALPEPTKGILEGKSYLDFITESVDSFQIRNDIPVLVIAHFAVSGAVAGDEAKDIAAFTPKESIPVEFFDARPDIDYVALGHIHITQELGRTGKVVYPGSLNYCSFSELNMKKGGYICRISDDKKLKKKFVELKSPIPLNEIRIDVRGDKAPMDTIRKKIKDIKCDGSIVKTIITIHESEFKNVDENEIRAMLGEAVSASVALDIVRGIKTRDSSITTAVSKRDAYFKYVELTGISDEMKATLRDEYLVLEKILMTEKQADSHLTE